MNKPKFDPSKPFEAVDTGVKPKFDPSKPFEEVQSQPQVAAESTPQDNPLAALGIGAMQGASFGFGDEAQGAVGGLERGVNYLLGKTKGDKGVLDAVRTGYISDRDAARAQEQALIKSNPISSFAGQIASGLPSMAAKGAITIPSMIAQGAASGLGNAQGDLTQQATGAVVGGGIGGALGGAAQVVGMGANKVGNLIDDFKVNQAVKALGAQKTQLKNMPGNFKKDVAEFALDNKLLSANPLKDLASKQEVGKNLQSKVGSELNAARDKLPQLDVGELITAIKSKSNFNPKLGVNSALTNQLNTVTKDIKTLAGKKSNKVNAKDILDLKSQLYTLARKANGEVNPTKDVLESARRGISEVEKKAANSGAYDKNLKDYAILKKIEQLQGNKAAQAGNSTLGMGGLLGTGAALGSGNPAAIAGAIAMSPSVRSKIGETAAVGIHFSQDKINKLATKLKIDPKVVAYLLSRQNAGEK